MRVPDFFVVGAQKAGTTWLHDALSRHPELSLPQIKETHFFSHDDRYSLGFNWYQRQFARSRRATIFGEIDPEYMFFPSAATRIKAAGTSPRFVFLLRQPLERAYSHYLMSVSRGQEDAAFREALVLENKRLALTTNEHALNNQSYLSRGRYSAQIARFQTLFPASAFLFIKFEDLFSEKNAERTYRDICAFIGIRSVGFSPATGKRSNSASAPRSLALRNILYRRSAFRNVLGHLIPSKDVKMRIGQWLDRINQKPIANPRLDLRKSNIDAWIVDDMLIDIAALRRITGLNYDDWIDRLTSVRVGIAYDTLR